jgi:threonine aldolase
MNKIIDLRSDTVTKPSPEMRRAMAEAEVGDDVFGDDPTVNKLQEKVAAMLGKEAALFVPSGTMANTVAILAHTQPGDEVIVERESHTFNHEVAGAAVMGGVQLNTLVGDRGILTADQIAKEIREPNVHIPQTRLICLENTHNRGGGSIYPLEKIRAIWQLAQNYKLRMHLDGARLFNACVATGFNPRDYAQYFDSLMFCFSKGLGAPIGSILAGSKLFIQRAHRIRKMLGGGMRQVGILAACPRK